MEQNRDPRNIFNIMLIKTSQKVRESIEIKKMFASIYPNKKLLYAFITARGSIHFELTTPEEADCVLQGWKVDFFEAVWRPGDRNEQQRRRNTGSSIRSVRLGHDISSYE